MRTTHSLIALGAVLIAACSSSTPTEGGTGPTGSGATLSLVNALAAVNGTQVTLDQSAVALPPVGQTSQLSISAGTHQIAAQLIKRPR